MKIRNRKGFTLLEVIIVIIIIAILASVALPKLSGTLDYAKAKEAINFIGAARNAIEACGMMNMNTSDGSYNYMKCACNTTTCANILGVELTGGKYFNTYAVTSAAASNFVITVTAVTPADGNVSYNSMVGKIVGTGKYAKIGQ